MSTTTARTNTTWKSIGWQLHENTTRADGLSLGWEDLHDLARELAEMNPDTDIDRAQLLVAAAGGTKAIELTWDRPFGEDTIERTTTYVTVESVMTNRIRVHYWGFAHDVYLNKIRHAATPATVTEFIDIPQS